MYKIFEQHYHNKYGEKGESNFFIKKKITFLGITRWKPITHTECGIDFCYSEKTLFKSEAKAIEFVQTVLCSDAPREKWVVTPIKEITCK